MKVLVNDVEANINSVTFNDGLNYGRFDTEAINVFPYQFEISKNDFISLMSENYRQCMDEVKVDDEQFNDSSPFKKMGYVSIEKAFD